MDEIDVVVIGAGLSGLSAAKLLHEQGLNVIILEARKRVGGRTFTLRNEAVTYVDLGGSYVGPTQNRILRLADEFGIKTYPTLESEDWIFHSKGHSQRITGFLPPSFGWLAILDENNIFREIDKMGEEIPVDAPWDAPHAKEWDQITVKEFYERTIWTKDARREAEQFINMNNTSESHEASLLWFLWHVRQCGGSTRIYATDNGGQVYVGYTVGNAVIPSGLVPDGITYVSNSISNIYLSEPQNTERKFLGGSQQISESIVERLGKERLLLDHAVCSISQKDQTIQVSCINGKVFKCRHVVMAIPLPLQTRLTYDPPLPALRNQLIQRVPMGSVIKTFVYYDKRFWLEKGSSGNAMIDDEDAIVEFTVDDTKKDGTKPAIVGFIIAGRARKYAAMSAEERRDRICQLYARIFETDEALKWGHYEEMDWLADQWSGGCYSVMMPPGFLTTFGKYGTVDLYRETCVELRKPVGGIFFAGTETATQWSGYMEGAVQAGERAAREILFDRGEIDQSEIWKDEPENKLVKPRPIPNTFMERNAPSVGGFLKILGCMSTLAVACTAAILYRKLKI